MGFVGMLEGGKVMAQDSAVRVGGGLVSAFPAVVEGQKMTARDVLNDKTDARYELDAGVVRMMSRATTEHQRMIKRLLLQMDPFFAGKKCEVHIDVGVFLFPAPDWSDGEYVKPDLLVLCDPGKDQEGVIRGAPDLVVEVLSPSTSKYDMNGKKSKYRRAGVREYWVVDGSRFIKYLFNEQFECGEEVELLGNEVESTIFPGLKVTI